MSDDSVGEVVEGLWRFVALHPESNTPEWTAAAEGGEDGWDQLVSWWVVAVSEGLVLIDPLVEDWQALDLLLSDRGGCLGIVRTCHWHQRGVAEASSRTGWRCGRRSIPMAVRLMSLTTRYAIRTSSLVRFE
jgi:hypothetical protein